MDAVTSDTEHIFTLEDLEDLVLALLKNVGKIVVCFLLFFASILT